MYNFESLFKRIKTNLDNIEKSISLIDALKKSLDYKSLLAETFHLAYLSEIFTNNVRGLAINTGIDKSYNDKKMNEIFHKALDFRLDYILDGKVVKLKINRLLPKKEHGSATYIRTTLHEFLKQERKQGKIKRFKEPIVICFQHVYTNAYEVRDHDNIELNAIVDLIALFFLNDDSPRFLDHFYTAKMDDRAYTNIYLIPKTQFTQFLDYLHYGDK